MKWNVTIAAAVFVGAVVLAACHPKEPPVVAAITSVDIAKPACEIDTLAEEHKSFMRRVGTIESGVTEETDEARTILLAKLLSFRAEVDAGYRFVTASCNNYNMCMQAHGFEEQFCTDSRRTWSSSHERFNELAVRLAELERHPRHGRGKHRGHRTPKGCDCSQGDIFDAGCCYDGD